MIKLALAAIWICTVSIGAVLYSFQSSEGGREAEQRPPFFGGLDYLSTNILSVPVVRDGKVDGYFLARLSYTVEADKVNTLTIPPKILLIDEIYSHLYGNPQIDYTKIGQIDLDAFRNGLRDAINERVGVKFVHDVLIEQVDYLSKNEIRDNTVRRRISPAG